MYIDHIFACFCLKKLDLLLTWIKDETKEKQNKYLDFIKSNYTQKVMKEYTFSCNYGFAPTSTPLEQPKSLVFLPISKFL